jgi:predicted TIM-barrel fold metal-dependent hydrolase
VTISCLPSRPVVRAPKVKAPPLSCDCHFHIFGEPKTYPLSSLRDYTPPSASVEDYRRMASNLGLERMVIVQPSVYGTDNRCTLDALSVFGKNLSRAVVVLDASVSKQELNAMNDIGVRGVRFNMVNAGGASLTGMAEMAHRIAALGWHLQIFIKGHQLKELAPVLIDLPTPVVIDHMGLIVVDSPTYARDVDALRTLLESDRVWVKLCGYRASIYDHPYTDVTPLARMLIDTVPERCVWGTDWPHPGMQHGVPDDADLLDLLGAWASSEAIRHKILVDNPALLYGF